LDETAVLAYSISSRPVPFSPVLTIIFVLMAQLADTLDAGGCTRDAKTQDAGRVQVGRTDKGRGYPLDAGRVQVKLLFSLGPYPGIANIGGPLLEYYNNIVIIHLCLGILNIINQEMEDIQ
jgi:hypothetical protein